MGLDNYTDSYILIYFLAEGTVRRIYYVYQVKQKRVQSRFLVYIYFFPKTSLLNSSINFSYLVTGVSWHEDLYRTIKSFYPSPFSIYYFWYSHIPIYLIIFPHLIRFCGQRVCAIAVRSR